MTWQEIRQQVLERDNYTCQTCFVPANNTHHLIPRRMKGLDVLENLTTVCDKCHGLLELKPFGVRPIPSDITDPVEISNIRAKVSRMGDKIHIIIPKSYHKDMEKLRLVDQFVDVELTQQI